ncbi:unnamed protein product [Microthlaspi erraticum]|uniref:Bifunctional inhibitor/plant lipid transfer protein/seed storage helical domain-containing protein n=1 Tax=Microthlaspi erraticum TaxID=1685480 RepID=A0A6D2L388_9BRAS|nr:unnamed protein product [Microthlaspi erraticum]
MAYINKVSAATAILFLAVAIAPLLAEPQPSMFPKMDLVCATVMPDLLQKCFGTVRDTPTEDCCNDLKSANATQVTCLCDHYIANPALVNITGPYSAGITTKCGVFDKYSCDGKGEEKTEEGSSSSNSSSSINGKDTNKSEGNGGRRANSVAASMAVFGLVASLIFVMF